MKCIATITNAKGNRRRPCKKNALIFIYCKEHWRIFFEKWKKRIFRFETVRQKIAWVAGGILLVVGLYKEVIKPLISTKPPCGSLDHISGKILPVSPQSTPNYVIDLGAHVSFPIETQELQNGFEVSSLPNFMCVPFNNTTNLPEFNNAYSPLDLMLKIKDEKLYVSVTLKDYDGEIIGRLKDSKWEIRPTNIAACDDGDDHFEILDKGGNVAFRIQTDSANIIHLRGYFIQDSCGLFLRDGAMQISSLSKKEFESIKLKEIRKNKIKYCKFYTNE
jgi:hypothetical protein